MNIAVIPRQLLLSILLLSIIFPATLQGIKTASLGLAIIGFLFIMILNPSQVRWTKSIFITSLLYATIGLLWSFYGELCGNPGATRVVTVMVMYPIIFTLLGSFWKPGDAAKLHKIFMWFGLALIISQGLYIGSALGLDGGIFQSLYGDIAVVDQGDDYFLFTLPSVASLIFFLPFYFTAFVFDSKFNTKYLILFLCAVVIVLLTGRRAIYLSFAISILSICSIIVFGCLFNSKKVPIFSARRVTFIFLAIVCFITVLLSIGMQNKELLVESLRSIFDFQSDSGNIERKLQFGALKDGISQNIIFGAGAGAAASYSRSYDQPWAYELFYVSTIFHYGFVGFLIYLLGILFLVWKQLNFIFNQKLSFESRLFSICFLSGFISFLVATATNPYIGKFDYMWVIFIPVMMVNCFDKTNEV